MSVLYPCYFNAELMRSQGRKVPLSKAVKNPTLIEIEHALKKNGVKFRVEQKHHPGHWAKREGRIIAEWDMPKRELLKRVIAKMEVKK